MRKLPLKCQKCAGRHKQSLAESSFDAWTKFYQQDENASNAIVSYYTKGALLAFVLDIEIRKRTDDNKSLDDVLRLIYPAISANWIRKRYRAKSRRTPHSKQLY